MIYGVPVTLIYYGDRQTVHGVYTFTRLSDANNCLYHIDASPYVDYGYESDCGMYSITRRAEPVEYYYSYDECVELNDSRHVFPLNEHMFYGPRYCGD